MLKVLCVDGDDTLWTEVDYAKGFQYIDYVTAKVAKGEAVEWYNWIILVRPDGLRLLHLVKDKDVRLYSYNGWGRTFVQAMASHLTTLTGTRWTDVICLDRCLQQPPVLGKSV